jgi:hypothetical protein
MASIGQAISNTSKSNPINGNDVVAQRANARKGGAQSKTRPKFTSAPQSCRTLGTCFTPNKPQGNTNFRPPNVTAPDNRQSGGHR